MPSAYTAPVVDGTITELAPFAKLCARALGVCVTMRDAPFDAPLPERFEPDPYHRDKLAVLNTTRDALLALTPQQATGEAAKARAAYDLRCEEIRACYAERKARYEAMIAKVEAWEGAPEGIKGFMLEQLREGMKFDCIQPSLLYPKEPPATGEAWVQEQLAELGRSIIRHTQSFAEELQRTQVRNAWLAQLRASLGEG